MKRNAMMVALTGLLFFVVVLLSVWLHNTSRKETIFLFREHQLSNARNLSNRIESFLWSHSQEQQTLLSTVPSLFERVKQMKANIRAFSKRAEGGYVRGVSLYDATGSVIYSTDYEAIGSNQARSEFFARAKAKERRGKPLVACNPSDVSGHLFLLGTPFYQGVPPRDRFAGIVSFAFDLEELITAQLDFVDPQVGLPHVWIMDGNGQLLYQSEHPEMERNDVLRTDKSCGQCHPSFDYVQKVMTEKEGTIEYSMKNGSRKLAAFAPVQFENTSWVVVVNSPYDRVMAFARKSLRKYFLLLGIVVLVFAGGSAFIMNHGRLKENSLSGLRWLDRKDSLGLASVLPPEPLEARGVPEGIVPRQKRLV